MREPIRCQLPRVLQTFLWFRRPVELMRWCETSYGPVFSLDLPELTDIVFISDPALIREIFTGDPELLHAGEGNQPLEPLVGKHSLLLLDGQKHLRMRRLMLPAFHGERMRAYANVMRDISVRCMAEWPESKPFATHPSMQEITLEVILRTVFGLDEREHLEPLRAALLELLEGATNFMAPLFLIPSMQRDWGPWKPWTEFTSLRDRVDELIRAQIIRQRARLDGSRDDVLSLLLSAVDDQGRPLSDDELRDELMTLLVAGHETTATSLSWAFERILAHRYVFGKLRAELDEVIGDAELHESHLAKLGYLDATVREVLRLRPVVPVVARQLTRDVEVGGLRVKKGQRLAPCIYLTQRRAESFPQPEAFRPERFVSARVDPYSWFPFGGGIRRCLGMAFAMTEMKVILASAIHGYELELAEPVPVAIARRAITLAPASGTLIRARKRHRAGRRESVVAV